MSNDILRRLYWACSDESRHFMDGLNLGELYRHSTETDAAWEAIRKKLKEKGLNGTEDIADEMSIFCASCEEVGFINGFRLGMKLAGELRGGVENDK